MPRNQKAKKIFGASGKVTRIATQIYDATVAPQHIRFLQDTSLFNEARQKLEKMVEWFCSEYGLQKPRTYRKVAHKEYLAFAKAKKPSTDRIRQAIRQQLVYGTMLAASFRRVISWIRSTGRIWKRSVRSTNSRSTCSITIRTRSRIGSSVSVSRMCGRPVVHGKVIKQTESGAKLHLSIDEWGLCKN